MGSLSSRVLRQPRRALAQQAQGARAGGSARRPDTGDDAAGHGFCYCPGSHKRKRSSGAFCYCHPDSETDEDEEEGDEQQRLLSTPRRHLRLQYIISDLASARIIEQDAIVPSEWLSSVYKQQWFAMLRAEQDSEVGPQEINKEELEGNSMRCGRKLAKDGEYCWRWTGFNFGFDLLVTYTNRYIIFKRNTLNQPCSGSLGSRPSRKLLHSCFREAGLQMGRSRSRSPRRERRRSRSTSRERERRRRERSRSRERDRRRSRSRSPHRRRSRSPRRHRSTSPSPSRLKERRDEEKKETKETKSKERQITEEDLEGKTEEEIEMMKLMGFASFDSTKGKKVDGSVNAYAINVSQKRKYRQYMNRKGGFNRPLDFIA
ncbi:hypothetical protein H8959_013124 [Pygathrix nigripes]